jgi:choline-sulfatase
MDNKPNIIVILTDDHGAWAMGCAGNSEILTPNLDRLASTGIRFENFFCVSPVCSPARASLLTGKLPSQHGVHDWLREKHSEGDYNYIQYIENHLSYTDILADNGYVCGISGKWHLGDSMHPQKNFEHWYVHKSGSGPYYNAPMVRNGKYVNEEMYVTDAITDNALEFIKKQGNTEQPFYLSIHYTAPHSPWDHEEHPKNVLDLYKDCPFKSCPEEPLHKWHINTAAYGTGEKRKYILQGYYSAVTAMDKNVGRILDKLHAMGIREKTLIFFTSDNGMNMGHHGIFGKGNGTFPQNMYDTSVKVPAIISQPGYITQGKVYNGMLSHYDFMPTLLDYLNIKDSQLHELPGISFAPLLKGEKAVNRDKLVVFDEYGPVRMIRTKEWKYIHRYPYGPHELYDLVNDPDESENLIEDESKKEVSIKMKNDMEKWFVKYVNPEIDGVKEAVYGKGQINLAGIYGKGKKAYADDWYYVEEDVKKVVYGS